MMKKFFISLLSVGMLLGIFGVVGSNNTGSPNLLEEETVQADSTNNSNSIHYEVYDKKNSSTLSTMNMLFTKSATITPNDNGGYTVTLTARDNINNIVPTTIDSQTPTITKKANGRTDISFKISDINALNEDVPATMTLKTKVLGLTVDSEEVLIKFDLSSLDTNGSGNRFVDSLQKITNTENDLTKSANDIKGIVSDLKSNSDDTNDILSTPNNNTDSTNNTTNNDNDATDSNTNDTTSTDPKTILKEITYKIAKSNGDGSLISPYFTNTAKVMQNPDGSYYVEATIKYPRKFGNNAFEINSINGQSPFNLSFKSDGDYNYVTFDFPIKKLTDLSNLIPGNISMNLPDFGLNKDLNFNFDFSAINPSDLSNLMSGSNSSDLSDLISGLGNLSDLGKVKTVSSGSKSNTNSNNNQTPTSATLPKTGNETNDVLVVIGGAVLIMVMVLIKGTYLKQ